MPFELVSRAVRPRLRVSVITTSALLALLAVPALAGQGIEKSGSTATLWFDDGGWTGSWNYLCIGEACYSGTKVGTRWQRTINEQTITVGNSYQVQIKIQDNATGQYISPMTGVVAVNAGGGGGDTQAPTVPTNLQVTGTTSSSIALSWSASSDNVGVTKYDVYRGGTLVGSPTGTTFTNSGLAANTTYSFSVRACDAAGNCSSQTTAINGTTAAGGGGDTQAPTVPTGLTVTAPTASSLTLNWSASTDNVGVTRYDVYRGATLVSSPGGTSYIDSGLAASTTYAYRVRACDAANNCSAQSAAVNGTTTSGSTSTLDWTTNAYSDHNVGPPPRANPPDALATPTNGSMPTLNGFAFDINGSQLAWRWGPYIIKAAGDADLEMHCSEDAGMTFKKTTLSGGTATIPCVGTYTYFFRYKQPGTLTSNPATAWAYTGYFTIAGARVNPNAYTAFVDGSANWMRFRHPISHDGVTAAILDAQHNNDLLRNLDRYTVWVNDSPGNVQLNFTVSGSVLRVESMTRADNPNGQQFFAVNQNPGFGNAFSYGQVISFELTAVAGRTGAQTYNDFSHYTVGYGWSSKYGDPRLASAGKASTSQLFSDTGAYSQLEKNAIFTQPMVTVHSEDMIDDFIVGHHLFHGIDPKKNKSTLFDEVRIGTRTCGGCHFRDGRGSEIIQTTKGPRLPPPIYGVKLLEAIAGRTTGFTWDGSVSSVAQQVRNALQIDHGVDPATLPAPVVNLLTSYTEQLTVPSRDPGSYDRPGVEAGDKLFMQVGCGSCHTPVQRTSATAATHLRNLVLRPYTDMKVWNVNGGSFRTAPLWGLWHNLKVLNRNGRAVRFMHDGSATSIDAAIQKHTGDGATVRGAYNALSATDRANLVKFVESL